MNVIIRTDVQKSVPATLATPGNVTSKGVADMDILTQKKKCSTCGELKDVSDFHRNVNRIRSECKACRGKALHKAYMENPKTKREREKLRRLSFPEKLREAYRKWYGSNKERVREYQRANRSPEKVREKNRNRNALVRGGKGKVTRAEWDALKAKYNYTCLRCGRREPEIKLELDHVLPLKLGGSNTIDNAQPLCKSCNSSKRANHVDYREDR